MKILKISGRNIRSLVGEFELDFTKPPLSETGIFAIVGPTGSGKSTILDTVCLALYGICPRIADVTSKTQIDDLHGGDSRTALNRSSIEGYAEIVFETDNRRYRSRWHVHRSHQRSSGKIQPPGRELIDETLNKTIASKSKTVTQEITRITHLNFNQFMRSVLLAQGEFAAFLKATADERAKLLENITGLSIYTELSIRAHQKAVDFKQDMSLQQAQMDHIELPTREDEKKLKSQLKKVSESSKVISSNIRKTQKQIEWHQTKNKLKEKYSKAKERYSITTLQYDDAESKRLKLAKAKKAAGIKTDLKLFDLAKSELIKTQDKLIETDKFKKNAREIKESTHRKLKENQKDLEQKLLKQKKLQPVIKKARDLDLTIDNKKEIKINHEEEYQQIWKRREDIQTKFTEYESEMKTLNLAIDTESKWLTHHENTAKLASEKAHWNDKIETYIELEEQHEANLIKRRKCAKKSGELLEKWKMLDEKISDSQTQKNEIEKKLKKNRLKIKQIDKQFPPEKAMENYRLSLNTQSLVKTMFDRLKEKDDLEKTTRDNQAEKKTVERTSKDLQKKINQLQQQHDDTQIRFDESSEYLERIRFTLNQEQLRAELKPGEPCPVCGSKEHPYIDKTVPTYELENAERKRMQEFKKKLKSIDQVIQQKNKDCARFEERIQGLKETLNKAGFKQIQIETELENLQKKIEKQVISIPEVKIKPDQNIPDQIDWSRLNNDLSENVLKYKETVEENRKLDADIQHNQDKMQRLQRKLDSSKDKIKTVDVDRSKIETEIKNYNQQIETNRSNLIDLLKKLSTVLEPSDNEWKTRFKEDPEIFLTKLNQQISQYDKHVSQAENLEKQHSALKHKIELLQAKKEDIDTVYQDKERVLTATVIELDKLKQRRSGVLDGENPDKIELKQEKLVELITKEKDKRKDEANEAEIQYQNFLLEYHRLEREIEERQTVFKQADSNLNKALDRANLDKEETVELLKDGESLIQSLQKQLDMLEHELQASKLELKQRQTDLKEWETTNDCRKKSTEILKEELQSFNTENEMLNEKKAEYLAQQKNYKQQKDKYKRVKMKLGEVADQAKLWLVLDDLIGHHTGLKFMKFAQTLTLEQLIKMANSQLKSLAPRYQLFRPDLSELDIAIIDLDRASEVRAVTTLSGGESFLVSLALALGLAGLSGRHAQIGTLFIDEGFGTLDTNTLDDALASLELLQADQKTIGLISHVPSVQERISCQVQVIPEGAGRSRISIVDTGLIRSGF